MGPTHYGRDKLEIIPARQNKLWIDFTHVHWIFILVYATLSWIFLCEYPFMHMILQAIVTRTYCCVLPILLTPDIGTCQNTLLQHGTWWCMHSGSLLFLNWAGCRLLLSYNPMVWIHFLRLRIWIHQLMIHHIMYRCNNPRCPSHPSDYWRS